MNKIIDLMNNITIKYSFVRAYLNYAGDICDQQGSDSP